MSWTCLGWRWWCDPRQPGCCDGSHRPPRRLLWHSTCRDGPRHVPRRVRVRGELARTSRSHECCGYRAAARAPRLGHRAGVLREPAARGRAAPLSRRTAQGVDPVLPAPRSCRRHSGWVRDRPWRSASRAGHATRRRAGRPWPPSSKEVRFCNRPPRQQCTSLAGRCPGQDQHRHLRRRTCRACRRGHPHPHTSSNPTSSAWPRYGTRLPTRRLSCGPRRTAAFRRPRCSTSATPGPVLSDASIGLSTQTGHWRDWFSTTCVNWPARSRSASTKRRAAPALATCAELIRRYSTQPAVDLRHFVRWIFFNLYAGNNDSHAKNLSIYSRPGQGVTLTPFYDLMCTRMYPGLSQEFAFAIGGEYKPASMTAANLTPLAHQLDMRPNYLAQQAADLARRMPDAMDRAVKDIRPALSHPAGVLADRLQKFVLSTTRKLAARLAR